MATQNADLEVDEVPDPTQEDASNVWILFYRHADDARSVFETVNESAELFVDCGWRLLAIEQPPGTNFVELLGGTLRELDDHFRSLRCRLGLAQRCQERACIDETSFASLTLAFSDQHELFIGHANRLRLDIHKHDHTRAFDEFVLVVQDDLPIDDASGSGFHERSIGFARLERHGRRTSVNRR